MEFMPETYEHNMEMPFRTIATAVDGHNSLVCCPICGFDCVHLGTVSVKQGHSTAISAHDATAVTPSDRHLHSRGSSVELDMDCESGHRFTYTLEFHKGSVTISLRERPESHADQPELWRD